MDEKISSDELGEMRCSDLDVPLFTSQSFKPVAALFLHRITNEQWTHLADGHTDTQTAFLLSGMCWHIVDATAVMVLKVVKPQILSQSAQDNACSSATTSVPMTRNYYSVTEEDIQASLGNSFHLCFGTALGVAQEQSSDSDKLVELFAADVRKVVNQSLAQIKRPASLIQACESAVEVEKCASDTKDMVHHIIQILRRCRLAKCDIQCTESPDIYSSEIFYPYEVTDMNMFCTDSSAVKLSQQDFLTAFFQKLMKHITDSNISTVYVDFDGLLARITQRALGELPTFPETVGNIYISVFEELCKKFGSEKLLLAAIMSADETFEKAVVRLLREQLHKSTSENDSFVKKVRRFCHKSTNKVTPACEDTASVSPSKIINQENTLKCPPTRKKKHPAITKMLCTVARILKKPFTCCFSSGSKDE